MIKNPNESALKLSSDRKVSLLSLWKENARRWEPDVKNAFGLPAGTSCPGRTAICASVCYAEAAENWPTVDALVRHNWDLLRACGRSQAKITELLRELMTAYRQSHARAERLRSATIPHAFRIHWDGDFYSVAYARAWRTVMLENADIQFWVYTRSFHGRVDVVPTLSVVPNLSLYLSVDSENRQHAERYPDLPHAILDETFADAQVTSVSLSGKRSPKCPENARKVPLVGSDGRGACVACGLCVNGRSSVLFSITKS